MDPLPTKPSQAPAPAAQPCTRWLRWNHEDKAFEFNHLALGHQSGDTPPPKMQEQAKAWRKGQWRHEHAMLVDRGVACPALVQVITPQSS